MRKFLFNILFLVIAPIALVAGASNASFAAGQDMNKNTGDQRGSADQDSGSSATSQSGGGAGMNQRATDAPDATAIVVVVPLQTQRPFPKHGCWVQVFEDGNYAGPSLVVEGPRQIRNLDRLDDYRFFDSPGDSIIVGPSAKATLYEDEGYTGKAVNANANQRVADVSSRFGTFESMESLKVDCTTAKAGGGTDRTGSGSGG